MKLTTPYAVLAGFALVALAIASQPLTGSFVPEAWAQGAPVQRVVICNIQGFDCVDPTEGELKVNVCDAFNGVRTPPCAVVRDGFLLTSDIDDYADDGLLR